jgi:hypothetical protein
MIHREYREGDYVRRFSLPEVIDQDRISAALKNRRSDPGPAQGRTGQAEADRSDRW